MAASSFTRAVLVPLVALTLLACGDAGGFVPDDVEAYLTDQGVESPSCSQASDEGAEVPEFDCSGVYQGERVEIFVVGSSAEDVVATIVHDDGTFEVI